MQNYLTSQHNILFSSIIDYSNYTYVHYFIEIPQCATSRRSFSGSYMKLAPVKLSHLVLSTFIKEHQNSGGEVRSSSVFHCTFFSEEVHSSIMAQYFFQYHDI